MTDLTNTVQGSGVGFTRAQEQYRRAVDALGDTKIWREWRSEMDRLAFIRALKSVRQGRQAGRAALKAVSP